MCGRYDLTELSLELFELMLGEAIKKQGEFKARRQSRRKVARPTRRSRHKVTTDERACYAALRMHDTVRRYADGVRRSEGLLVQIRVGLNSGERPPESPCSRTPPRRCSLLRPAAVSRHRSKPLPVGRLRAGPTGRSVQWGCSPRAGSLCAEAHRPRRASLLYF